MRLMRLMTAEQARATDATVEDDAARVCIYWENYLDRRIRAAARAHQDGLIVSYNPYRATLEELRAFVANNNLGFTIEKDGEFLKISWARAG